MGLVAEAPVVVVDVVADVEVDVISFIMTGGH